MKVRQNGRIVSVAVIVAIGVNSDGRQDDAEAARAQWREIADQPRPKLPKLAAFMDQPRPTCSPT